MQNLKEGTSLQGGKYKIERMLGQGGFGITYLAMHELLGRRVAIKEFFIKEYCERDGATSSVTLGTQSNRDMVERFKKKFVKEARTLSKLKHPNIIPIYDVFYENNTAYYVMEYIEGQSLGDLVKAHGALPEQQAIGYIRKVASALGYIHKRSINHLDIKPNNIMLRRNGEIILIDFGVAKQYDAETKEGTTTTPVGISHGYSPLEQYERHGVQSFSPESDIYALGATLYKLVTGQTPPSATEVVQIGLPPLPSHLSASCRQAITHAMQPRKDDRPHTVDEFLALLGDDTQGYEEVEVTVVADPSRGKKGNSSNSNNSNNFSNSGNSSNSSNKTGNSRPGRMKNILVAAVAAFVALIVCLSFWPSDSDAPIPVESATETVAAFEWESPLGKAEYKGHFETDATLGKVPHGQGTAKITAGDYKGAIYTGTFNHGVMEGKVVYTLANGDVFDGTFKNNQYSNGTYTIKETGQYFVGSFKNGQPDQGQWYDKNGKKE